MYMQCLPFHIQLALIANKYLYVRSYFNNNDNFVNGAAVV